MRRWSVFCGLVLFLVGCGVSTADAHVIATAGYSTVSQDGDQVDYLLSLEYAVLARAVDLGAPADDDARREEALEAADPKLTEYLDERLVVSLDGAACEPSLADTSITRRADKPYADLALTFACPGSTGSFHLLYKVFQDSDAVADDHTNQVEYHFADRSGRTVFDRGHHDFTVGDGSLLTSSVQYGRLGVKHILLGLDHVLFVIALIIGAQSFKSLLQVTSTFTLAHSVTLISTLVGGLDVPSAVVEPLIALSITFVALENLLGSTRHRLPVVFGFGLLHGLGFAGSLRITDEVSTDLLVSLLSFNVGIETGQAILLAAVFPLLLLVRKTGYAVPAQRVATGVVAAFGLFWFVERFFLS
jgi:hydrogenase/urease accessory protein HupE